MWSARRKIRPIFPPPTHLARKGRGISRGRATKPEKGFKFWASGSNDGGAPPSIIGARCKRQILAANPGTDELFPCSRRLCCVRGQNQATLRLLQSRIPSEASSPKHSD